MSAKQTKPTSAPEQQYRFVRHDGVLYRQQIDLSNPPAQLWRSDIREWEAAAPMSGAEAFWFGTPLNVDEVRNIIFDPTYVAELIADIGEGKEE